MIAAAVEKGGPLRLPVRRRDLPDEVCARLKKMEEGAEREYLALGMDPCLDFQALLSCPSPYTRSRHLAFMITRERRRLEAKESLKVMFGEGATGGTDGEQDIGFL